MVALVAADKARESQVLSVECSFSVVLGTADKACESQVFLFVECSFSVVLGTADKARESQVFLSVEMVNNYYYMDIKESPNAASKNLSKSGKNCVLYVLPRNSSKYCPFAVTPSWELEEKRLIN